MNTFDSWSPSIDWTRFAQGPVSDPMWHAFREVVRLCHCYEHWRQEAHEAEIKYLQGNIRYGLSISDSKDKMRDAAELADKKIAEMTHAATTEGNPDFILCTAVVVSVMGLGNSLVRRRYRSLVLDTFDAAQLNNVSPMIISRRWQKKLATRSSRLSRRRNGPVADHFSNQGGRVRLNSFACISNRDRPLSVR